MVSEKLDELERDLKRYDANGLTWPSALQLIAAVRKLRAKYHARVMELSSWAESGGFGAPLNPDNEWIEIDAIITEAAPMLGDG